MDRSDFLTKIKHSSVSEVALSFGTVHIKPMTAWVRDRVEAAAAMAQEKKTAALLSDTRWLAIRNCLCDATGEPILTDDDRKQFGDWDSGDRETIFNAIMEVSKVTEQDREEFEKN